VKRLFYGKKTSIACVLLLVLCFASAAQAENDLFSAYQQSAPRVEGQAYVEFIPFLDSYRPVHSTDPNYPLIWQIGQFIKETNGVPFTVTAAVFTRFDAEHNVLINMHYEGDELDMVPLHSRELVPGEAYMYITHQPLDDTAWYGFRLDGVDANGNALSFCNLLELNPDPVDPVVPAEYADGRVGEGLIAVSPSENPVYTAEHEFFGGNTGWAYDVVVQNISDKPVTLNRMSLAYFDEELTRFQYLVESQAIADWAGVQDNILEPGESIIFSDISPLQALTSIGYRFTASAEDGTMHAESILITLNKELKPQ